VGVEGNADDAAAVQGLEELFVAGDPVVERRDSDGLVAKHGPFGHVAEDHRVRQGTVEEGRGDAGEGGVDQASLPLHHYQVGITCRQDQFFDHPRHEVADDAVDGGPAGAEQHSGLSGGNEPGVHARAAGCSGDLQRGDHLPDVAVRADGQHAAGAGLLRAGFSDRLRVRRAAEVDDARVVVPREGGELGIVPQHQVETGNEIQAGRQRPGEQRPPGRRELTAGGGDADHEGGRVVRQRLFERGDDRGGRGHADHLLEGAAGVLPVEDSDDLVPAVADQARRRLGRVRIQVAVR
jgi:hypothetical protein